MKSLHNLFDETQSEQALERSRIMIKIAEIRASSIVAGVEVIFSEDLVKMAKEHEMKERIIGAKPLSAFEKYLLSISEGDAIGHLFHCLTSGKSDSQAWGLVAEMNGEDWQCAPGKMGEILSKTLSGLKAKAGVNHDNE